MNQRREVRVPDIGEFKNVPVIELLVKAGDLIEEGAPLLVLESDKATLDVPAPERGTIAELIVKLGDHVSEGTPLLLLETAEPAEAAKQPPPIPSGVAATSEGATSNEPLQGAAASAPNYRIEVPGVCERNATERPVVPLSVRASPSLRRMARELGVDLSAVTGTGSRGRLRRADVENYVKRELSQATAPTAQARDCAAPLSLLPWPAVDFAKFGPVESRPLSRIRKQSGANLHRNWVMIPHVTNHDDADVTELEVFRGAINDEAQPGATKVTLLALLMKPAWPH